MARPFPNTFDKDSPMSPQSAGSNISYQTNVNRQKTRKWADAKPANYGGDDWGDDDEYDLPPPPISKPTGLRQQGQGLQSPAKADSPIVENARKYGDLPPLPGASNPRPRANSFDADDEKRNFSSNVANQPQPSASNAPATRFSQITGVPTVRNASGPPALSISTQQPAQAPVGLRKASQAVSPVSESPHPEILLPGRSNTGESSVVSPASDTRTPSTASDYHARRDFSPSAVPPPLATRASPAPQSATDSPATRFPARKSSLSQVTGPPLADILRSPTEDTTPKPWVTGRSASPGAASRSPATPTGKSLPFIRPADIYRRAEEERRQSLESSGRPSMDSLMGSKSSDRSESPAKPNWEKPGPDNVGIGGRRRTSFEGDDSSDAGRRLMPMLEPVRERKSEYGFEGFNVNDQAPYQESETNITTAGHQLDVEEARRQSTSPKLPDLTRMSGFGIDMFSSSTSQDTETAASKDTQITPIASSEATLTSSQADDLRLRTQPSFGFKSVVSQAFDRTDDHSIPNTPASRTGSSVRRTDSESTGTAGISPIMSRVSSTAIPETRNRDASTLATLEDVNEPTSPEVAADAGQKDHVETPTGQEVPGFKPGHRRDISAPSPGNSPARTPDLATPRFITGGQHAVVDDTPSDVVSPVDDNEPLLAPRPITEREPSFRPSLPGGWTSYATSARSESPAKGAGERTQTPLAEVSHVQERHDEDENDITPTTTKRSLPQSALGAAVAGATSSGGALGRHDNSSPAQTHVENLRTLGGDALPTPDLSMAPSGNLYSTNAPDPRLLPRLEQAPSETQLRPDVVDRPVSTRSSVGPSPPPKDTPEVESADDHSDYFPKPTVPLKQRKPDHVEEEESHEPPTRPDMLPTLSTDTRPYDEENDKLRKEIVKSLSPRPSNATAHGDSMLPDQLDDAYSADQSRESTYLPREYDNYWASTAEDEEPVPPIVDAHKDAEGLSDTGPAVITETPSHPEFDAAAIPPLSARRPEPSLQPPRPPLQNRFSWEESNETVSIGSHHDDAYPATGDIASRGSEVPANTSDLPELSAHGREGSPPRPVAELENNESRSGQNPSEEHHIGRDAAIVAGGAALGGAAMATFSHRPESQTERRLSLAEEKDPRVSSHPVSPTPPEDDHPSRSPHPYFPTSPDLSLNPQAQSTVSPVASPVLQQVSPTTGRLLSFREIVAMKSPQQRIKTFDETRHRFAAMDSGLTDWMEALQAQFPEEHSGASGSWGGARMSVPSSSARSKFSKAAGSNAPPPLQQPYYQQYLNASSPTTPSTPVGGASRPGPSMPTGAQQGFSSAGSKITTQQVQAKGKEFLHTAGIFGGKAGKAGKGLLAKGKNKLRGGDKTSPPPKPNKTDRRSSWGLPLAMSRSSGRPDSTSRNSRESTPAPTPERPRANTLTSDRGSPAPQLPAVTGGYSLGTMSGALPVEHPQGQQNEPPTLRQVREPDNAVDESEERDSLGVPAPIGKHQPSWDPFNATPIAEEEGFQYEEPPKQRQPPHESENRQLSLPISESGNRQGSLTVPADNLAKSDRSNSSDAHFFDAPEVPEDINNDWVMVIPEDELREVKGVEDPAVEPTTKSVTRPELEQETAESVTKPAFAMEAVPSEEVAKPKFESETRMSAGPVSAPKPEPEVRQSLDASSTSILNRPRGSFSYEIPSRPSTAQAKAPSLGSPPRPFIAPVQHTPPPQNPATPPAPIAAPVQVTPSPPKTELEQERQSSNSSFLPPIRRTSTFGLGFGSRQSKPRFPIEEDDDDVPKPGTQQPFGEGPSGQEFGAVAGAAATETIPNHRSEKSVPQATQAEDVRNVTPQQSLPPIQTGPPRDPQRQSSFPRLGTPRDSEYYQQQQQQQGPQVPSTRPLLMHTNSSEYNERNMTPQRDPEKPLFPTARTGDILQRPEFRESQVEWRPNRPRVATNQSQTSQYWKETDTPAQRNSWEPQRQRGYSSSSQSVTRDGSYNEKGSWTSSPQQSKPFEQPPSSAQRYPDLFRPGQPGQPSVEGPRGDVDLPAHYYQAPIPRAAAFLPRQQTNEYQLPGVGPPTDEPRSAGSKRNSGFFKEIGGRLSRGSSRERGNSISRDGGFSSPDRPIESRENEYAESSVVSEDGQEQRRRRASFFGNLNRNSTAGLGPPASRESIIAHHAGSRTDLLASPQPSLLGQQEKKRSFFGGNSTDSKSKPNKLVRASTGTLDASGKKNRFSALGGFFGKSSQPSKENPPQQRPQATRELSHNESRPIESPRFEHQAGVKLSTPPSESTRAPSQSRKVLTKFTGSSGPSQSSRQDKQTRRPSASGLLNGFMGRRSYQKERGSDDSRSQGSAPQVGPQPLLSQTYTDLQQEQQQQQPQALGLPPQQQPREVPFQDPSLLLHERGRRFSREPQYDSVPIPGGYSLVRGQGATPVATDYDPRGFNRLQQVDPRYPQAGSRNSYQNYLEPGGRPQQYTNGNQYATPPQQTDPRQSTQPIAHLSALETYSDYAPHRISREDILARSPPKSPEGQQRPYQISLPGGEIEDDDERPTPIQKDPISPASAREPVKLQHDAIQRLQQPLLRHPESPAGYPLPDDTVFSPINPGANDIPPPPPPKWPSQQHLDPYRSSSPSHPQSHERHTSLSQSLSTMDIDLDRSNTRRTAVSAISGISAPRPQSGGLNVPGKDAGPTDRQISPSPSPPSPMQGTPDRVVSPDVTEGGIKRTEVQVEGRESDGELDLYSASPRLPRGRAEEELVRMNGNGSLKGGGVAQENLRSSPPAAVGGQLELPKPHNQQYQQQRGNGTGAQEEKIYYDSAHTREQPDGPAELEDHETAMSATSYPGQEWNPYGSGTWDDGID